MEQEKNRKHEELHRCEKKKQTKFENLSIDLTNEGNDEKYINMLCYKVKNHILIL